MRWTHRIGAGVATFLTVSSSFTIAAGPTLGQPAGVERSIASTQQAMAQRLSLDVSERPLKEVLATIGQAVGVTLNVMWSDAAHTTGLDPGLSASIQAQNEPVQSIIERVLDSIDSGEHDKATWQLSRNGSIQIGPRSRLNAYKRLQVYDVSDLLKVVPDHRRGPTIDLQQAISGNGVPLSGTDEGNDWLAESRETRDRAEDLAALIRDLVETEQWTENGGEGGAIKLHQNTLIINAADYIHRALTSRAR